MKKRTRGVIARLIVFWILLLVVGYGFCYSLFVLDDGAQLTEYFESPFVSTETMFLLLAFCILMLLGIFALTVSVVDTVGELRKIERAWAKYEKKAAKKKSKSGPRFNMLNMIDREFGHQKPQGRCRLP